MSVGVYILGMEGLLDHWKLGGESGMLPGFMKLMEEGVKVRVILLRLYLHACHSKANPCFLFCCCCCADCCSSLLFLEVIFLSPFISQSPQGDFIQPLAVRIEENYLPKAPVEVLSGACQVFVKFLFSKELGKLLYFFSFFYLSSFFF